MIEPRPSRYRSPARAQGGFQAVEELGEDHEVFPGSPRQRHFL
jgi:hypothetical protein